MSEKENGEPIVGPVSGRKYRNEKHMRNEALVGFGMCTVVVIGIGMGNASLIDYPIAIFLLVTGFIALFSGILSELREQ